MKARLLSILAVSAFFFGGCAGNFDFTFDRIIGSRYSYSYGYGHSKHRGAVGNYPIFNCSIFPQGSEERAACDEGLREREQQYLGDIQSTAYNAGYDRGINGLPDEREKYCSRYDDVNRRKPCGEGYDSGYDNGRAYYLDRIRERARRSHIGYP